jgi:hypothetical protein
VSPPIEGPGQSPLKAMIQSPLKALDKVSAVFDSYIEVHQRSEFFGGLRRVQLAEQTQFTIGGLPVVDLYDRADALVVADMPRSVACSSVSTDTDTVVYGVAGSPPSADRARIFTPTGFTVNCFEDTGPDFTLMPFLGRVVLKASSGGAVLRQFQLKQANVRGEGGGGTEHEFTYAPDRVVSVTTINTISSGSPDNVNLCGGGTDAVTRPWSRTEINVWSEPGSFYTNGELLKVGDESAISVDFSLTCVTNDPPSTPGLVDFTEITAGQFIGISTEVEADGSQKVTWWDWREGAGGSPWTFNEVCQLSDP